MAADKIKKGRRVLVWGKTTTDEYQGKINVQFAGIPISVICVDVKEINFVEEIPLEVGSKVRMKTGQAYMTYSGEIIAIRDEKAWVYWENNRFPDTVLRLDQLEPA